MQTIKASSDHLSPGLGFANTKNRKVSEIALALFLFVLVATLLLQLEFIVLSRTVFVKDLHFIWRFWKKKK